MQLSSVILLAVVAASSFAQANAQSAPVAPTPDTATQVPAGPADQTVPAPDMGQSQPPPFAGDLAVGAEPMEMPPSTVASPFVVGPFVFRPHVSYDYTYAKGVLAEPGEPANTSIQTFAPGLLVETGKVWSLDYTPSWVNYSSNKFGDSTDQYATLKGKTQYEAWTFGLTQAFQRTNEVLVSTGQQTPQKQWLTNVVATYALNSVSSINLGAEQDLVLSNAFPTSRTWSTADSFHYAIGPALDIFAAGTLGYSTVRPGFDMSFERLEVGTDWRATHDFTFTAEAGAERRQVALAGESPLMNGIFDGSVVYQPINGTKVAATFVRSVDETFTIDEISRTLSANLTVEQEFFQHFFANAGAGIQKVHYIPLDTAASLSEPERNDRYVTTSAGVGVTLFRRARVELKYSHARNNSGLGIYSFDSDQYECVASISY